MNRCKVAYFYGKCHDLLFHAMKKGRVTKFHGQAPDAYAYV